ncbi:UNVERIFIED_CONTAM: translation initiation factor eIF-2B subunit alpha [Siphonaria sp. JEL0065]|nr:translation initiation factor eIF-2B subunit alpha [Siphonaria sp. JEL0065]
MTKKRTESSKPSDKPAIRSQLDALIRQNPDMSLPVAAVKVLAQTVASMEASTMSELTTKLMKATGELQNSAPKNYSVIAGTEEFLRQLKYVDDESVAVCRERVAEFERRFVSEASGSLEKIAAVGVNLIKDGAVILIHSFSRVVMVLLERAAKLNRRYSVIVTESRPSHNGQKSVDVLTKLGVPVKLIPDSAVGFVMEKVDMVLVGAEAVVENGGLINQMGTYQIALVAKAANKPFYSVTETHKFLHMFPLSQSDIELQEHKIDQSEEGASNYSFVSAHHVDYTPPQLVSSLITNFGVLTPSGVVHLLIS